MGTSEARARESLGQWGNENGSAELSRPGRDVLLVTLQGNLETPIGLAIADQLTKSLRRDRISHAFFDLERMVSYESQVRVACTKAILEQDHHVNVVTLSRAALVRMGVAVANIALGGRIKGASDRAEFDALLAEATRDQSASATA